ncbi:MAG TPA: hypothetical protein VM639_08205 [Dongiaceae bacterium]|nr:hypothetical protein [Dongiaceae bacterium]
MTAVRVTQYIILLIATALLGYAVSGASQGALLFLAYLCFGMAGAAFVLRRGQETLAVVVWGISMLLVGFIFDSDNMLGVDYQPTTIGMALLWAVPVIAVLLRFAFWVIDRLRVRDQAASVPHRAGRSGATTGRTVKTTHPAYPWLIGCWLLWPLGTASIAMLDESRWDRMRYDNSLLLLMFLPPLFVTIGFLLYRHWRERKSGVEPNRHAAEKTTP